MTKLMDEDEYRQYDDERQTVMIGLVENGQQESDDRRHRSILNARWPYGVSGLSE